MLRVEALHVRYGAISAVRGVDLECQLGEIVALIGANGAGKSSTLGAIAGGLTGARVSGRISWEGSSLLGKPPEQIVRQGVCLVPEGRRIFGTLTVRENLRLGATARNRADFRYELGVTLEHFPGLVKHLDAPAGRLSGGEQQQLSIARALLAAPRLLLLDEPSQGLAPRLVDEVFSVLADLRAKDIAILLVEQAALRAMELADRSYMLKDGRMYSPGAGDVQTWDLAAAYLGHSGPRESSQRAP